MYTHIETNEKVNYNPLVLVWALFAPTKQKADATGFWNDEDGKTYIDHTEIRKYTAINLDALDCHKKILFAKGELAIFYKNQYNEGVVEYPEGHKEILKHRIAWVEPHLKACYVKYLLAQHGGLTIYRSEAGYLIEIYK